MIQACVKLTEKLKIDHFHQESYSCHDDQVDATSIILAYFKKVGLGEGVGSGSGDRGGMISEGKKSLWR